MIVFSWLVVDQPEALNANLTHAAGEALIQPMSVSFLPVDLARGVEMVHFRNVQVSVFLTRARARELYIEQASPYNAMVI